MKIDKLQVKIELTRKCGLHCNHCSSKAGLESGLEIKQQYIDCILKDAPSIEEVVLTGGEPLSCSHFFQTLEKINMAGFLPSIYTSGIFDGDSSLFEKIIAKISKLTVSLHGPEIIHDRITNRPGSFRRTMGFIKEVLASPIPIGIHVIALRNNIELIPDLTTLLKNMGLFDISILRYVPQGRGPESDIEPPSKDMLHTLYNKISKNNVRFGAPFNFIHNKNVPCKVGFKTVMVDVFGNVIPCDSFKDLAGNSPENSLSKNNLVNIINESWLFDYVRRNSMASCESECCLGQYLLEQQKSDIKIASYA